jgi:hypothetical protein
MQGTSREQGYTATRCFKIETSRKHSLPEHSARKLVRWADENIAIAEQFEKDNLGSQALNRFTATSILSGRVSHYARLPSLSGDVGRYVTESILHMRHALDQACWALWQSKGKAETNTLYFPIAGSHNDLLGKLSSFPYNELGQEFGGIIKRMQPFPQGAQGGSFHLTALSKAAQNKHRITCDLIVDVGPMSMIGISFHGFEELVMQLESGKGRILIGEGTSDSRVTGGDILIVAHMTVHGAGPFDGTPIVQNLRDTHRIVSDAVNSILALV